MGFFDTVARLTITEVFKTGLAEVNSRLNPDEMVVLLQQAEVAADAAQPEIGGLFRRIDRDGANGYQKFLKFFQSGEVLTELQKPLKDCGKPDVNILVEAFNRSALENLEAENYRSALMPLWMKTFVESYFEQVKGICFQVAKAQYLEQLSQRVNKVKFVGMAVSAEEVETQKDLVQIFVMPDVREKRSGVISNTDIDYGCILESAPEDLSNQEYEALKGFVQQKNLLQEQKKWALRDRSAPRVSAPKVLNLRTMTQKKAVLLGEPGSGKTMLSSYFALMLCQSDPAQISLDAKVDWLPIFVRIRDWISKPEQGLLSYLRWDAEENLSIDNLPLGFFEHWLERGQALILLDGLDEVVNEAQRSKVSEKIETFLHRYQDNPAVITSRPAGYQGAFNLDEFPHYTLESFDDKQMATFIDHWYDSRLKDNKAQAERRKVDLQKAFARNERIRLLARNPLLLTLITLIHRDGGELPKQRYKLYARAVDILLIQWDYTRDIKLDPKNNFFKSADLLYVLKKIAYWIHTQGSIGETEGGTLIDKDELIRQLRTEIKTLKKCELYEATAEAKRFIDFIKERTGLLNEQGIDRYAFVHKTFQEYLTAEEIFDRADVEDDTEIILAHFRQHLHDQHWREVLLLLVSKLKGKKAQKAIQAVLDAGSEYEQWLHRDLLFAGWCLTEDPPELTVVAADWVGGILDRLVGIEIEDVDRIGVKISSEVQKILHCFSETTIERTVWEKLQTQEDRIDCFQLLKFQASLGQESESIDKLLSLLKDEDSEVRASSASLLGDLGNATPAVVNGLLCLRKDAEWRVRFMMANSLKRLGEVSPLAAESLLYVLDDEENSTLVSPPDMSDLEAENSVADYLDEQSKIESEIAALCKLGEQSLLSLLESKNWRLSDTLAKLWGVSAELDRWLLSPHKQDEEWMIGYLDEQFKTEFEIAAFRELQEQNLLSSMRSESWGSRCNVVKALGELGNASSEVVDGLLPLLIDAEWSVRNSAAEALGELENASSEVVSGLLCLLRDRTKRSSDGIAAAPALCRLAKTSDTVLPEVVQWLEQNRDEDGIGDAIDCLWSIVVE